MSALFTLSLGLSVPGQVAPISEDHWNLFLVQRVCVLLEGFHVRDELGFWQDEPEPCKVITVVAPSGSINTIEADLQLIARWWCQEARQDAALLTCQPIGAQLITTSTISQF